MPLPPPSATPQDSAPDKPGRSILAIWQRNLPQTLDRLMLLDDAASAAQAGNLTPALAVQARDTAHKFAGSLGTFGYPEGTRLARELEQLLETPAPSPTRILDLTTALRASIFPPAP